MVNSKWVFLESKLVAVICGKGKFTSLINETALKHFSKFNQDLQKSKAPGDYL